jgi:hypothetical protein
VFRTISRLAAAGALLMTAGLAQAAEDRTGSTSTHGTASTNYANSRTDGQMSLSDLAAMPKTVEPFPVPLKTFQTRFLKGKTRVYLPSYALTLVRSGKATAYAGGFGSTVNGRRSSITTGLVGVSDELATQLAGEAYADMVKRLKEAGYEVITAEGLPPDSPAPLGAQIKGITGQPVYSPPGAPLRPGAPLLPAFSSNIYAYGKFVEATDAIVLQPGLGIDYEWLESSGNHNYSSSATVGARLRFHAVGNSGANIIAKSAPPYRGGWPGSFLVQNGAGTDEPFAIMYEIDDRSDSRLVSNAMALAGFGSMYRQSKVYAVEVDPDRYAALVRAAFQGMNASIIEQMKAAAAK